MISAFGIVHTIEKAAPGNPFKASAMADELTAKMIRSRKKPELLYRAQKVANSAKKRGLKGSQRRLP